MLAVKWKGRFFKTYCFPKTSSFYHAFCISDGFRCDRCPTSSLEPKNKTKFDMICNLDGFGAPNSPIQISVCSGVYLFLSHEILAQPP